MNIQVARLRDMLDILKTAVPRNPSLKILANVMVKDRQMSATDLDSYVTIKIPEADESFLFPYTEVVNLLRHVPGYEYLDIHCKQGTLTIDWSEGSATYPTASLDDFPSVPEIEVKDEADIDGDTFIPALASALPYVATDEKRPVLQGVTVQFGAPIEVCAGDGFRMAHIVLPLQFPAEHTTIIPAGAVSTLLHVMAKSPRTPPQGEALIPIVLAKRQLHIALDGKRGLSVGFSPAITVMVKLVEGKPPAWLKLIPKEEPILKGNFFARELEAAVRRVSDVAKQNKGIVRFEFNDGNARVSAKGDGSEISAKVSCFDLQGTPNRFALNIRYLTDYLKDKDSIVAMTWTGNTAPVAFQHSKHPKVLIMPMEAKWEKDLPKAEANPATAAAPEQPAAETPAPENSKPKKQRKKKEK